MSGAEGAYAPEQGGGFDYSYFTEKEKRCIYEVGLNSLRFLRQSLKVARLSTAFVGRNIVRLKAAVSVMKDIGRPIGVPFFILSGADLIHGIRHFKGPESVVNLGIALSEFSFELSDMFSLIVRVWNVAKGPLLLIGDYLEMIGTALLILVIAKKVHNLWNLYQVNKKIDSETVETKDIETLGLTHEVATRLLNVINDNSEAAKKLAKERVSYLLFSESLDTLRLVVTSVALTVVFAMGAHYVTSSIFLATNTFKLARFVVERAAAREFGKSLSIVLDGELHQRFTTVLNKYFFFLLDTKRLTYVPSEVPVAA